jgi:catechol-2,3-dioxygenase
MLSDADVVATLAVKDIDKAKEYYGKTLGLNQVDENPGGVTYKSGSGKLFVYQSQTAGTGEATCASWGVSDVGGLVSELKEKGVKFEHYEMPGVTREGDIHVMGPMKAVWFKDPDGNILNATQM